MGIGSMVGLLSGTGDVSRPNVGQASDDFNAMLGSYLSRGGDIYNNEQQFKPGYAALDTGLFNRYFNKTLSTTLPVATSALRKSDPMSSGLLDTLGQQAAEQLKWNGNLDPAALRGLQQSVRGSQAARGLGYGPGDAAMEQFYQTQTQEQRRAQNQQLAGNVAQQRFSTFGLPALGIAGSAAGQAGNVAVNANPSLAPSNMGQMLTMPYEASLQQNLATAQNNTGLVESMDRNQTSMMDSVIGKL